MKKKVKIQFDAANNSVPVVATMEEIPSMAVEGTTLDVTLTDEGSNTIQAVAVYTDAAAENDAFVVDAILVSLDTIPAGVKFSLVGIAGEYEVQQPQKIFWLSDIIKAHDSALPTRTKLNVHTSQTFAIVVSELPSELVTAITTKTVASNVAGLEGTNEADTPMEDYIVLSEEQIAVTLAAESE